MARALPVTVVGAGIMWSRIRSTHKKAILEAFGAGVGEHFAESGVAGAAGKIEPHYRQSELTLVDAVISEKPLAATRFIEAMSATLWSAVTKLEGDGAQGEEAFLYVVASLKADGYVRLRGFDGRARLSTYLALVTREILADRLARRFDEDPHHAWKRFTRFFESDIRRRVAHRLPRNTGDAVREDVYQDICLALIDDNFHRIRSYGGRGSFAGYVLTIVDRILIDIIRRDAPRRRLPAAIARLSPLDQAVYATIVWDDCSPDVARLVPGLRGRLKRDPDAQEVAESLARVVSLGRLERAPARRQHDLVSLDALVEDGGDLPLADPAPTPEDHLLLAEEEHRREALIAAVKAAATGLSAEQRLYLQIVFSAGEPLSARDIARAMGNPVEEVYRLKQRTQRWLKELAAQLNKDSDQSV
jgi:RNA polymerase primary sigma factor